MAEIGIFYGSDTGNTEHIAKKIKKHLDSKNQKVALYDIATSTQEDIERYNYLIFGIPTWYYGESQCDWDDFFPSLSKIDFSSRTVAIFGCGDQEDYAEYFCDAMGTLRDILLTRKANIIGHWPTADYHFEESKSLVDANHFTGLAIDEDRQPELTEQRVEIWVEQICRQMAL